MLSPISYLPSSALRSTITYAVKTNSFNDNLPVIPKESKVESHAVLFRLDIQITVMRNGAPVVGQIIPFLASGGPSHARMLKPTDKNGTATLRLETRISGSTIITPRLTEFASSTFRVDIGEAWYEATFLITAYNCCDEDDFSGALVDTTTVGKRKTDFLYGGTGICMQGTGVGSDGRFITVTNPKQVTWNPGYAGVSNPDKAVFAYSDAVHGAYAIVTPNASIAIDPHILPPRHRVDIIGPRALGTRSGDDTGGAIKGHHFDNYAGAGKSVMTDWQTAGGNITAAKVKYLGA